MNTKHLERLDAVALQRIWLAVVGLLAVCAAVSAACFVLTMAVLWAVTP